MAYRVTFALDTAKADQATREQTLRELLGLLCQLNLLYLGRKRIPPLQDLVRAGKVRPAPAPAGQEEWKDIPTVLASGYADEEDLAAWQAAENSKKTGRLIVPSPLPGVNVEELRDGRFLFALDMFNPKVDRNISRRGLNIMLGALYRLDLIYLRANPNTPSIYEARPLYMEEPVGQEEWQDPGTCIKMGTFDCEDGACWRAAELTLAGIPAIPIFQEKRLPKGSYLYHIVTKILADGRIEDPSRILGMK